ncbi:MAG: efflux RND transporter permease subunit [Bacteroidota bacterium]|nr:efflux RND transporter permease subunit [Bacteroidota bacterium]MDP4233792.1 efflux RND transporter permease subunit [Bacteroidota bacterium]MDP4242431.1 efflux RND transporter permease subunit [Bacteroidota bacterium]MDP4287553.1 efflux RND transporter permease subunit [Bacteroidota bacterium]
MFISDFAIKRPVVTITTMLALVIFGIFALRSLQIDEFPDVSAPFVMVMVPYPGASPEQVEREVVVRMEQVFGSISGMDVMNSKSMDGFAMITCQFVFSKNPDQAMQDVRDAISGIQNDLPLEMKPPILKKYDPDDLPIVSLILRSPGMSPADLTSMADPGITKEIRAINGVAQVTVSGAVNREISVNVRPADLEANGVSVAQVVQALQTQNLAAPVGALENPQVEQSIRLQGRIEDPEQFKLVPIATRNGQVVRLGDVADVRDTAKEARSLALFNGVEAVGLDITKSKGASTATVSNNVKAAIDDIKKTLPPGTSLEVIKDAGERVTRSVNNVKETLFEGAFLTVLVVFLFLNSWRSTVITGIALPVSVLAAFIAVMAAGFTLNVMSLMGLSLAIGILIDDAIVVRENIVRHVEMGEDHFTASHTGTNEIGLAVTATTFSIVAVFAPVGFMSGISGQWFKPFALTIACAVMVSLFVSFSLDPMLSAYWPDPQTEAHERRNWLARLLDRFNNWFNRQADKYRNVVAWALDHRWSMVGLVVVVFFGAIFLQAKFGGSGFAPSSDRSELTLSVETPPGSSLDYTRSKCDALTSLIRAHKEVPYVYTTIGNTANAFGGSSSAGDVTQASIYIKLVPKSDRHISADAFAANLRQQITAIGGVKCNIFTNPWGATQKEIQYQIRGTSDASMEQAAEMIEDVFHHTKGAVDVGLSTKGQKPEVEVNLRRGLIGTMGLSVGQTAQSLMPAFAGLKTGDWVDPNGKTRDVTVRLAASSRANVSDLLKVPIVVGGAGAGGTATPGIVPAVGTQQGSAVLPLGQIADIKEGVGPAEIDHLDQDRVINVEANTSGRSLGEIRTDLQNGIAKLQLPAGIQISNGAQAKNQDELAGSMGAALGLAILLMYLILVVQFGSFLDPLAILISLPLSLIGVVLMLLATGDSLNIMSMIGVMMLMGVVAKNAILLIDFAKWQHEKGMPLREALIEAGRIRLRPILMTTLALIAGMLPVAIGAGEGADFRAPLGRAVIGGVITSTILTLVVIPTIYELFSGWRDRFRARFGRKATAHAPASVEAAVLES